MSGSTYLESSGAFVKQLLNLDIELATKTCTKDQSADEIYHLYSNRLSLLEKSSIIPLPQGDKLLLEHKKEDVYVELMLFKIKQDIKEQLEETLTQLDDLEELANSDKAK